MGHVSWKVSSEWRTVNADLNVHPKFNVQILLTIWNPYHFSPLGLQFVSIFRNEFFNSRFRTVGMRHVVEIQHSCLKSLGWLPDSRTLPVRFKWNPLSSPAFPSSMWEKLVQIFRVPKGAKRVDWYHDANRVPPTQLPSSQMISSIIVPRWGIGTSCDATILSSDSTLLRKRMSVRTCSHLQLSRRER